jgi:hypothetical protein
VVLLRGEDRRGDVDDASPRVTLKFAEAASGPLLTKSERILPIA